MTSLYQEVNVNGGPLVSVIIPVFNSSAYIEDAVRSALAQDYGNKEIIVVDDGSTDSTPDILETFQDQIVVVRQVNAGPGAARNHGLQHARGTYIAFLDADDVWIPGKLRLQVEYLQQKPAIGAVYSKWLLWHGDAEGQFALPDLPPLNEPPAIVREDSGWVYTILLFECRLLTSTVVLRRSVMEQVGPFDEYLLRGQDYDYWLRLSRITEIHKLDSELVLYRIHSDNIASKYSNYNYELMVVEQNVSRWGLAGPDGKTVSADKLKRHLARLCFSFGYWQFHRGTLGIARNAFRKSLEYQLTYLKSWLYLGMSVVFGLFPKTRRYY
jgi:glycosyltransferase involved in cell wall biosynthesis